jgi:hypothetical protein
MALENISNIKVKKLSFSYKFNIYICAMENGIIIIYDKDF